MQKRVNLADLVKSFPTSIYYLLLVRFSKYLQNLASMQPRTSFWEFGIVTGIWEFERAKIPIPIPNYRGNWEFELRGQDTWTNNGRPGALFAKSASTSASSTTGSQSEYRKGS